MTITDMMRFGLRSGWYGWRIGVGQNMVRARVGVRVRFRGRVRVRVRVRVRPPTEIIQPLGAPAHSKPWNERWTRDCTRP